MDSESLLPAASVPPMHVTTPVVGAPLVIEYVARAPGVTYIAPTPVDEVAFTTSASAVEYVAPAPAVHVAWVHPAPTQSHVAVAEFVEYLHSQDRETPAKRFGRAGCRRAPQRRGGRTEAEGSPKRQTLIVWTMCEMAIRRELRYTNTGHMSEPRALEVPFVLGHLQNGRDLSPASAGTDSRLRAYRHG